MAFNRQCSSCQSEEWVKGKVVGSGSFGTVHLAMNKATGSLFVVKSADSGAGLRALENEADILSTLNSPYVVECLGRNLTKGPNGKLNIFLEYMAGGSLSDVTETFGGSLNEEVIQLYTREILMGLKYLQENGIVHCDLKCKNVLLRSSGNVKLADFGCARRMNTAGKNLVSSENLIGGTPLWMAPEVLRNEEFDFTADIWSLGCTVIEMATGRPPWSGDISNPVAAVMKIACSDEIPEVPAHFSKEGIDFLTKCLERDPKKRWKAWELLEHPFITGNIVKTSRNKCVCSPASVLDAGKYEDDSDSSSSDDEFANRNPFSTNRSRTVTRQQPAPVDSILLSSEDWITVR
ncbi:hypothetical protein ACFE04_001782 [Oxalis oulophora]